ncbi:MAG: type I polyketide synthase, partial [Alphaproteobacteria bacterium]|nr:type I polyketide synthase [Alphaproteobacteria bacterium]
MQSASEIAIIGYACRVPGARTSQAFWQLLKKNRCSVTWITPDRFPTVPYHHPSVGQHGRSYTFAAGVIDDVWGFDATAFGMSPREAEQVDPQHRHLLEVAHDALTHAGIPNSSLSGTDTGVYIGASSAEYTGRFINDPAAADVHMMTGNSASVMANRISYTLNLRGPSLTLDTACSSSLVALHLASEAIRSGTIDTAIVGGVNLLLSPVSYIGFSQASMLSPTGLCRPFDAAADGYVRSEGIVVLVLRGMSAAHKARNRIHGVLIGSGVNQDGRTTGLSLPSAQSQRDLLEQVYDRYHVDPADLWFVEAHGTGTRVGDPIEADALGKGLGQKRAQPLPIGSVKSNIGHLEPVSGLAGVLKSLHALREGMLPATLHQQSPNADIPFDELNLRVVGRNWRRPERRDAALAGVNSFGFGGTNAHAILRSDNTNVRLLYWRNTSPPPPLLLSAHSADALPAVARAYDTNWPDDARAAGELIQASAHLRDPLPHRVLIRGASAEEIRHHVRVVADGGKSNAALVGQAIGVNLPVAFLFSGNGSQWAGMGRDAWHANPQFRQALEEIDGHFARVQKWSIVDMLFDDGLEAALRQATYSQPMLLALQIAIVRALEDSGVVPAATLGHSVGEIAAAWAAGALSLEQAIAVVVARSRHQEAVRHSGGMAAFMLSEREARRFLASVGVGAVEIAAVNSWRSVTVAGPPSDIETVLAAAAKLRISGRRLDLDYPFHSALIEPVRDPLLRDLEGLKALSAHRHWVSSVTGEIVKTPAPEPSYWWRNVREPVRFDAAFNCLLEQGVRVFVEIGPRPVLSSYVRDILREAGARGAIVDTLTEQGGGDPVERAVSKVLLSGGAVDLPRFFGPPPAATMPLPAYPWQHTSFSVRPTIEGGGALSDLRHPLLGRQPRRDCTEWFSTVDPRLLGWLEDHKFGASCLFPAAAYVEVMLAAAREKLGEGALELRDLDILRPLVFEGNASYETLLRLSPDTGIVEFLSRARDGLPDWTLHARATACRSPISGKLVMAPQIEPGTVSVARPKVYECARALGFEYGPTFQRARLVAFPHPKRAIAPLEPPARETTGPFAIDFTALDTALHVLFTSEEAGVADMPMRAMLPVRFGCLRSYKPGTSAALAVTRTVKQSLTSMLMDIELFDASGELVLVAEKVRLMNAPTEAAADPLSLGYRTVPWHLERAGRPALLSLRPLPMPEADPEGIDEGVMLLEAGCLRAVWDALSGAVSRSNGDTASTYSHGSDKGREAGALLRSALLWHLELRGLVVEQGAKRLLADACNLPDVSSIVTSLTTRHPQMVSEAASLARMPELLPEIVAGSDHVAQSFGSPHWRHLATASSQVSILRERVTAQLHEAMRACDRGRLLRLLMIGGEHVAAACDLVCCHSNIEVLVADPDADRLEQARLVVGEDFPRIRCEAWAALVDLPAGVIDLAFAIDGLSEVAATPDGLASVRNVLRPGAPLLAGELAPSLFWDIVRGTRSAWWLRSASAEFPVGPLLTPEEWIDELTVAGFDDAIASSVTPEPRVGVLIQARAGNQTQQADLTAPHSLNVAWHGDAQCVALRSHMAEYQLAPPAVADRNADQAPTDVVWTVNVSNSSDEGDVIAGRLAGIAACCRELAAHPARFWVLMDFAHSDPELVALERPLWCALTAALRVVRNEYPGLQIRCLGIAGGWDASMVKRVANELLASDQEKEIFLEPDRRVVFRIHRGVSEPDIDPVGDGVGWTLVNRHGAGHAGLAWLGQPRPALG